jgi:hypothetical protein
MIRKQLPIAALLFAAVAVAPLPSVAVHPEGFSTAQGTAMKWSAVPSLPPGASVAILEGPMNEAAPFTARLRFPSNYRIPAHWHPAVKRVTVLTGTLHIGLGEAFDAAKAPPMRVGDFRLIPARTPHFAFTTNEAVEIQLHGTGPWGITYLNPADDPRKQP